MIVDTSALVAILRDEADAVVLIDKLLASDEIRISAGTLLEAHIVCDRDDGQSDLDDLNRKIGVETVPVDDAQVRAAFEGFRQFGKGRHPAKLNFGDCFAYALAKTYGEPLLFKGNDFRETDITPAQHGFPCS